VDIPQLTPGEPLSPELVLVLSPELRAQALAALGPPQWPAPRRRAVEAKASVREPFARAIGEVVAARAVQLALVFVLVTAVTLVMSLVAHALR
jgi:hypothetical protein